MAKLTDKWMEYYLESFIFALRSYRKKQKKMIN